MSVKEIGQLPAEEETKLFRSHDGYGIPFGKVGTAKDYAQLILMVVSVCLTYSLPSGRGANDRMCT